MKRDEGSWRSNPASGAEPEAHRSGAQVSLSLGIQTDDEFNFSHVYMRNRDIPDYGFPFDAATRSPTRSPTPAFSPDTFWGIDANFDDSDVNVTTGTWTHAFSPTSELRTTVRYGDYERSYWARTPNATQAPNANGTIVNGTNYNAGPTRSLDYETLTVQSDFNTQFRALGMKHELVSGVQYLHEDSHRAGLLNLSGGTAVTSFLPPSFQPYVEGTTGLNNFTGDSYALYVQDTVELIPFWKATLGIRRDQLNAEYSSATSTTLSFGEWSTRAALSYQPTEAVHYYFGYSDSFIPTADLYQLTLEPQLVQTGRAQNPSATFFGENVAWKKVQAVES